MMTEPQAAMRPHWIISLLNRFSWAEQLLKFCTVGGFATLVHVGAYIGFIEQVGTSPLLANALAFSIAVLFSFAGHAGWTFRREYLANNASTRTMFARFGLSAVLGLMLNTAFVFALVTIAGLAYGWTIPCFVILTPLLLYLINRHWVFAD